VTVDTQQQNATKKGKGGSAEGLPHSVFFDCCGHDVGFHQPAMAAFSRGFWFTIAGLFLMATENVIIG
jgi:hypothetical protein